MDNIFPVSQNAFASHVNNRQGKSMPAKVKNNPGKEI
jgi:hypothetical protein